MPLRRSFSSSRRSAEDRRRSTFILRTHAVRSRSCKVDLFFELSRLFRCFFGNFSCPAASVVSSAPRRRGGLAPHRHSGQERRQHGVLSPLRHHVMIQSGWPNFCMMRTLVPPFAELTWGYLDPGEFRPGCPRLMFKPGHESRKAALQRFSPSQCSNTCAPKLASIAAAFGPGSP